MRHLVLEFVTCFRDFLESRSSLDPEKSSSDSSLQHSRTAVFHCHHETCLAEMTSLHGTGVRVVVRQFGLPEEFEN